MNLPYRSLFVASCALTIVVACGDDDGGGNEGEEKEEADLILEGTVLTPDESFEGQVVIDNERIVCVAPGSECADQFSGTLVATEGIIAPGLIDTHNHILFDIFDETDWAPTLPACPGGVGDCESSSYCAGGDCACMDGLCKYLDHDQWPDEAEYGLMLDYKQCLEDASQGKPVWCPTEYDGAGSLRCELNKWGELKGLMAGTTSIVGLPGQASACFSSLARSIDVEHNDLGFDKVQTSATFPPNDDSASKVCENFTSGTTAAYLIHVGEGVNQKALDEFTTLFETPSPAGCLYAPQTTITHGTAFGPGEFAQMAEAGMKLTWSPASNVALYGTTTDIPAALEAGVMVSLAPDWSMGGSQNLLDELRFADAWDNERWGDVLTPKMLVEMVTVNAAAVLGMADVLGRIETGYRADIMVFSGDTSDPHAALLAARPSDVRLVLVDGEVLFGDSEFEDLASGDPECESVDVCGANKFVCVAEDVPSDKLGQTLAEIQTRIDEALINLDGIQTIPTASCAEVCEDDEVCYERTMFPEVPDSNCPGGCPSGEACYQTSMSGSYECLTTTACSAPKDRALAPVTPLVRCE